MSRQTFIIRGRRLTMTSILPGTPSGSEKAVSWRFSFAFPLSRLLVVTMTSPLSLSDVNVSLGTRDDRMDRRWPWK